jgi:hypothetical protein
LACFLRHFLVRFHFSSHDINFHRLVAGQTR